jgi:pimeloyl-ACP methyl ester carboxylesterase
VNLRFLLLALVPVLGTMPAAQAAPAPAPAILQGKICHLPGMEEGLRCSFVQVPLDGKGTFIPLHVTLAPALREAARPDPLFVLAGGPGQAGSDVVMLLGTALRKIRATRDIVFIDQRGTGRSGRLDCPGSELSDTMADEAVDAAIAACVTRLRVPLAAYSTANAAQDIERVRRQLGYGKINVFGGSYGTRLAQAYARAYPNSVRSLLLDGVAAPDQIIPAGGRDGQAALDALFDQCAKDAACAKAYPELRSEFASLAARVADGPLQLAISNPRTAAPLTVTMNSRRFLMTVHNILYAALDGRRLPFLIHSAHQGRWEPFIARSNAASDFSADGKLSPLLYLAVTCPEDLARLTPELYSEDAKGSFLGAPQTGRLLQLCRLLKLPAASPASDAVIEAPALMLSGGLDPVTPPRRAIAAGKTMSAAQHMVVQSAGHGVSSLGCVPRLLREFVDTPTKTVDATCLTKLPAPAFVLGSAGPQP